MTIRVEVNGVQYDSFVKIGVTKRLEALTDTFSFDTSKIGDEPLPIRGGESCKIVVDGETVLTGFIETVRGSGDEEQHEISASGRDRTADLVDSTLDGLADIRPPITLKILAERVIERLQIPDISVIDAANTAAFNKAEDLAAPEPGTTGFEFLERYARKRQVLLSSDADGNVLITQASGVNSGGALVHLFDDPSNNVLSYSFGYDLSNRYRRYITAGQLNMLTLNQAGAVGEDSIVDQSDTEVTDDGPGVRIGRQLVLVGESMFSNGQGRDRTLWEANIRRARSRTYTATVDGFRNQAGDLWRVNRLVRVRSDYAGIDALMLVQSLTYSLDEGSGGQTQLTLVNRDAYTLALAEPMDEVGAGLALT